MCWADRHTFSWGSSTAADELPLHIRCDCGAISRTDIEPIRQAEAEIARLRDELTMLRTAIIDQPTPASDWQCCLCLAYAAQREAIEHEQDCALMQAAR